MDKLKFGSYIKESRMKKKYTQQELAELLFVDVSTVSKWERGITYPDITLVPDICRVLEISEHELIASCHDIEYRKIKKDANKYNNMKKGAFLTINILYIVALVTCFIVNIAISHTLSWFYIVAASILCAYSFCPTITWLFTKHKSLVFLASTFVSLFLLFLTCSIYTNNHWFMIATIGVLLGYVIVFYPILFKRQKKYLNEEKYKKLSKWFLLTYMSLIFIIIGLLLVVIYLYNSFDLKLGLLIDGGVFIVPILFGILSLFDVSEKWTKGILIVVVGVLLVLIFIALGRAVYLKLTETSKVRIIEENYNGVKIEGKAFDVNIYLSTNNENKVEYLENEKISVDSYVEDGVLIIKQVDNRAFYDYLFNLSHMKVDLYLSKSTLDTLNLKISTGDIKVNDGFQFENAYLENSTGHIEFNSNVMSELKFKSSTGDIKLNDMRAGGLDIKTDTGNVNLINVLVDNDFNMQGSTGDLYIEKFDAANINVSLSTGNVNGTILTPKIFNAFSKTGRVVVPETYSGGICKIKVSTGDIIIAIYK